MRSLDIPEQHDTLHGVPAPAETAILFGHEPQQAKIADAYRQRRLHHALLLEGPQGVGKATFAFHLAQHLIANPDPAAAPAAITQLDRNGNDFRQLAQGTHNQLLHLTRPFDAKSEKFKTVLTVDETRRIGHFLSRTNIGAGSRCVIIDPVTDMNASAANALLKNLEEPPPRTVFMLIAHSSGRILPTIRSRCQRQNFAPLGEAELAAALRQACGGSDVAPQEMNVLAEMSEGSVRRALLLRQFGGMEVIAAANALIGGKSFNAEEAAKLGDALAAREADIQFQLLTDHLLHRIMAASRGHAEDGRAGAARAMAALHEETRRSLAEAEAFNLDRKQTVFGLIVKLREKSAAGLL